MARDHERYAEDVAPYVLGALAPLEAEALEKHMRGCADCQREYVELRSGVEVLSRTFESIREGAAKVAWGVRENRARHGYLLVGAPVAVGRERSAGMRASPA